MQTLGNYGEAWSKATKDFELNIMVYCGFEEEKEEVDNKMLNIYFPTLILKF